MNMEEMYRGRNHQHGFWGIFYYNCIIIRSSPRRPFSALQWKLIFRIKGTCNDNNNSSFSIVHMAE